MQLTRLAAVLALASCTLGVSCGDDTMMSPVPILPEDYESTYTQVRDCRQSGDHDLHVVRVLADPVALAAYADRSEPFPAGAIVVKEEYEFGDVACTGPIEVWTVMEKLEVGSDPEMLDWRWQTIEPDRRVRDENLPRCAGCHAGCGVPPDGYDGTCTVP
jgi:hypothetical protein